MCQTPDGKLLPPQRIVAPPGIVTGVPAGSTCWVTEDPTRPPPPPGYQWEGIPSYSPKGPIKISPNEPIKVIVTNTLKRCEDKGSSIITKIVKGVPEGKVYHFTVILRCWTGQKFENFAANFTYPGAMQPQTIPNLPLGSVCTIEEQPLEPLPPGYFWMSPTYSVGSGTFTIKESCCQEIQVVNEAHYCCQTTTTGGGGIPSGLQIIPPAAPTPRRKSK